MGSAPAQMHLTPVIIALFLTGISSPSVHIAHVCEREGAVTHVLAVERAV